MPYRDQLQAAQARINDLERQLSDKRAAERATRREEKQQRKESRKEARKRWFRNHDDLVFWIGTALVVLAAIGGMGLLIYGTESSDTSTTECRRYARAVKLPCSNYAFVREGGDSPCFCPAKARPDGIQTSITFSVPGVVRNQYRSGKSGDEVIYP